MAIVEQIKSRFEKKLSTESEKGEKV